MEEEEKVEDVEDPRTLNQKVNGGKRQVQPAGGGRRGPEGAWLPGQPE